MDGMNLKRQRRPNVRLGEIGDVSAAALCGTSQTSAVDWEERRWKPKPGTLKELVSNMQFGFPKEIGKSEVPSSGNRSLMHGEVQVDAAIKQEHGNDFDNEVGGTKSVTLIDRKPSFELGPIVKKVRVRHTKVRGRGLRGGGISSGSWKSPKVDSDINNAEKCHEVDVQADHAAKNVSYEGHKRERFKDSDLEPLGSPQYEKALGGDSKSKDPSPDAVVVNFEQSLSPHVDDDSVDRNEQVQADSMDYLITGDGNENNGVPSDDANCMEQGAGETSRLKNDVGGSLWGRRTGMAEKKTMPFTSRISGTITSVKEWLDELGFAKYAHIFEIHEVDNEALPLLTFEDLKEIGINAVGPRRKLYTAIQLLRDEISA